MGEYPYYEFATVDGPLSDEGMRDARGCSSRATVSRVRWHNVLEGLPATQMRALLERVAQGDGSRVMSALNRLTHPAPTIPARRAMSCTGFAAKATELRQAWRKQEAEAAAAKRKQEAAV